MSLNYTDKGSDDRSQPAPSSPDVNGHPLALGTTSINPRAAGTQSGAKIVTKDSKIVAYDGSNNIGLFGFDDSGNMVVKVAKTGFDANTATGDNLVFNSGQNVLKVSETANVTITGGSVGNGIITTFSQTYTFTGSYTKPPIILAFYSGGGSLGLIAFSGELVPLNWGTSANGIKMLYGIIYTASITTTNVAFEMIYINSDTVPHTASDLPMKIYLLQETIS